MEKLPLIDMTIDDEHETGVEFISFVDTPAIEREWMAFNKKEYESYSDYPKSASNNAKRALEWADKNGWGGCGTSVGKQRANQLAKGEAISRETISRMASFNRHRQNKDVPYSEGCGGLMWDAWGGTSGVDWAINKMKELRASSYSMEFKVKNEEKRIVSGAIMVANLPIYRRDEHNGEYYVKFSGDAIQKIVERFFKNGMTGRVNLDHNEVVEDVYMIESFIIDERKKTPEGFAELPKGSWFGSFKVENDEVWKQVKDGTFRGFSIEGMFTDRAAKELDEQLIKKLIRILNEE